MTPVLMSFLLLFTIVVALVFGISLGYGAVCGILHFFKPARPKPKASPRITFASSASGD